MFYEKISVPAPTFCPICRNQQRFATRNAKSLYHRACDRCKTDVVSRLSPQNPAKMFCKNCWWADDWDGVGYGCDYDFSRPFFTQFHELLFSVPHVSIFSSNMIESEYSNMESDGKKCYLTFGGHYNENCAFTEYSMYGKEVYDSYWSFHGEQCYEDMNIERCYRTFYSRECINCIETHFSYDCRGCTNVIACAGLRNKQYCIFNKQYSKEEYEALRAAYNFGSHEVVQKLRQEARKLWDQTPHRATIITQSVNSWGNNISNSKNVRNAWQVENSEDSKNLYVAGWAKDCYDETSCGNNELSYMGVSGGGLYNCKAILYSFSADPLSKKSCYNAEYCYTIINSRDCFGCVGLRKKQYCILNKQYTKEEYEALLPKIKAHMKDMPYVSPINGYMYSYGDFFPNEHSLFAYNESGAQDFYPMTKEEAERAGFVWRDEPGSEHKATNYVIPDDIKDVGDDILQAVLICEKSGKAYRITKAELDFYRTNNLPIPRVAPLERIRGRINELLPFKLFDRTCMKCNKPIQTPYSPDRPEVVYCESCYQQALN